MSVSALANGDDMTVLLLLPVKKEMYPLSTAAFTRAQSSRRKLANGYRDALVLDRDGNLRKIEHIDVLAASSAAELLALLKLPDPEDALDVL